MSSDKDLFQQLADLADGLGPVPTPEHWESQLRSVCSTARLVLAAAAVSIARVVDDGVVYVAADGAGAAEIEGTELPTGQGLAGFVASSGQSLVIDRVADDPRFAAEVAESTGYVPTSMLVVPVVTAGGSPIGVLSVLDRGGAGHIASADALEVAGAFASQAALVLPQVDLTMRIAPILLTAIADAARAQDPDLAEKLRSAADSLDPPDGDLAKTAALLADLRTRDAATRASAERVLEELLSLSAPRRRR